jgi:AsmA family protein
MSRKLKIIVWSVAGLLAILAICLAILLTFDWNRAKPWLNERISEASGRPFAINGDLALSWKRSPEMGGGWRTWIPWPHLVARDITLGNPAWARTGPLMTQTRQLSFSINPLALLGKKIAIPTLQLDEPTLNLERSASGQNNWTFTTDKKSSSAWQLELGHLVLNKGNVRLVDAIKRADVKAAIDTLPQPETSNYGIGWKLSGSFNGETVSGYGKAGAVLSLQTDTRPYPLEVHVRVGKTTIDVNGTLTRPRQLAALDLQLRIAGASMAHLYPLTGIVLPETPSFSTAGHLKGTLNAEGGDWLYQKFNGRVGSSDLSGTLKYESRQPRPLLSGTIVSSLLQFQDLAPLIGADSNASKARRGASVVQPPNKVLPVEPFRTERWHSIDADVKFTGSKIIRQQELPINNVTANIHLQDGVLSLTPLNFGIAGGSFNSNIKLDGRNKIVKAEMKIAARHLKLKQLFPAFQPMQASLGEINGEANLSAVGNSIATLLASSNGEIKALINQGTISKLLLEEIGLNLGNVVLTQLFGDKQVKLNCLASDFSVDSGLMQARTFVIDTDEAILPVSGQISLAREQLDMTIKPRTKGIRLLSLRAPLYVTGTFKKPQVNIDKGILAMKAGSAVALAVLAPIATALIPLANVGPGEQSECGKLLAQAGTKPVAPPVDNGKRQPGKK